jgi:hypothetical protein
MSDTAYLDKLTIDTITHFDVANFAHYLMVNADVARLHRYREVGHGWEYCTESDPSRWIPDLKGEAISMRIRCIVSMAANTRALHWQDLLSNEASIEPIRDEIRVKCLMKLSLKLGVKVFILGVVKESRGFYVV